MLTKLGELQASWKVFPREDSGQLARRFEWAGEITGRSVRFDSASLQSHKMWPRYKKSRKRQAKGFIWRGQNKNQNNLKRGAKNNSKRITFNLS